MRTAVPAFSYRRTQRLLLFWMLVVSAPYVNALQPNDEVTPEVQSLYAQARAARQSGDASTAIEKYRAIIKLAPHLAAAYNNLGMLYFDGHDYSHAIEILQRGLELNPNMP